MSRTTPNTKVVDQFFTKGMAVDTAITEQHVGLYYFNLLQMYNEAAAADKPVVKKRYINEYFTLSKLVTDKKMSLKTQETLNTYLNYVVKTCDDILPDLNGYMKDLPQEKEAKIASVKSFMDMLSAKNCMNSKEFSQLLYLRCSAVE